MPKKNEPNCKLCLDTGCDVCGDDMPECPTCGANKFVDTIAPDQGVFCCVKCGTEFVENSEDGDTALEEYWAKLSGVEEKQTSDKPVFGKVVDDTDPSSPKVV